ncbi:32430_t:CDS:2 [Gigaspora margarita]|uniref:32430_t:CDS:1 n=1 Tax=Gigaspora margarita TaxID=4874 RepID=A0ABN7URU1_GIGMA|nr:32430_t:CDS:2 [Gigaspora margarita]
MGGTYLIQSIFKQYVSYCHDSILGVPERMLKHLKENCKKEVHNTLDTNISFTFVENEEVKKLFKMLQPSYTLPSQKWISTEILDDIYEEVETKVQNFVNDSKFNFVWTNANTIWILQCLMLLGDKLIGFVLDSGLNMAKAQQRITSKNNPELQQKIIKIPSITDLDLLTIKENNNHKFINTIEDTNF